MKWNSAWALCSPEPGRLLISAGADEAYEIDGLEPSTIATARAWSRGSDVSAGGSGLLEAEAQGLADHLVSLGALVSATGSTEPLVVLGEGPVACEIRSSNPMTSTDLTLIVAEGPGAIDNAEVSPPTGPHLLVDATGHHTVVLGPYVIPGFTACVECLALRSLRRWPKPVVSTAPQVARAPAVIAQLVAVQVLEIERFASQLVNATAAWDLSTGTCQRDDLLKVPNCSRCRSIESKPTVFLPWLAGAGFKSEARRQS